MTEAYDQDQVRQVATWLKAARRVLFITGAGLSADSGMPTYRGVGGLYGDVPVEGDLTIEDLMSGYMMRKDPALVWRYLGQLATAFNAAKPNRGHEIISALEAELRHVWVLTQNVDGLHTAAGSQKVIDIHGDIHHLACMTCDQGRHVADLASLELPPKCSACGGMMRPDVILFGEMLETHKLESLQRQMALGFDVVFSVGTSSLFPYITQPVVALGRMGAKTVEINPSQTDISNIVDIKFANKAAATLEAIWQAYRA